MNEIKVQDKLFKLFIKWYRQDVGVVKSQIVTVADRINYFNEDDELICYTYLYGGVSHYIKKKYYNMMFVVDENKK
ncbi:hypothetical protein PQE70_gp132 [Bacillus phage vB_BanS_Nate]|uniref:Uncharacterized protein n=1 Tax=Bacillus phage vB_BanS_Nate TaxID=2894788 RepID=A0AAE9CDQ2_9CAUD|nr:hypothetical protein PQE70_gp132 [Bacillus phage vB_BanS_Nate]UGO50985.1 hypothetical protein NATE_132 [Bacillus phage vB_BanS_Nate]